MELVDLALNRGPAFLLVFGRMSGLVFTAPVFSSRLLPVQMRTFIAVGLAALVLPTLTPAPGDRTLAGALPELVLELATGLLLGFVATLVFTAVEFAGAVLDVDLGFAMATLLNPASGENLSLVGNFKHTLALLIFVSIDGHHGLIRAVVNSYATVPLGGMVAGAALPQVLLDTAAGLFYHGLQLALPVLAALFVTTVALGVVNRAVPQLNAFVAGLPIKMGVGLALIVASLPAEMDGLTGLFANLFASLDRLLSALAR